MVAKIKSGKSLIGALNYNERKVKTGKARLIAAPLFTKEHARLTFDDKLFRLSDLANRNKRTKTNTVHLSLNFDISEKLDEHNLAEIADSYMEKIGFGNQPYLVYQHFDAAHGHIHVVTTNIKADGNRISLHNIGKLKSEPARKAVELEFSLVQAESQQKCLQMGMAIVPLTYGDTDTKRSITNITNYVAQTYKFTSLSEFNAVLKAFNVQADRGSKETVMFKNNGLRYWALDENGKRVGVPVKASTIYKKPTLKLLEKRFSLNEFLRKPYKNELAGKIDNALRSENNSQGLLKKLDAVQVKMIMRVNDDGRLYGLTFVDDKNKVVFNGSDLGKPYSASAIESRLRENSRKATNATAKRSDENMIWTNQSAEKAEVGLLNELLLDVSEICYTLFRGKLTTSNAGKELQLML